MKLNSLEKAEKMKIRVTQVLIMQAENKTSPDPESHKQQNSWLKKVQVPWPQQHATKGNTGEDIPNGMATERRGISNRKTLKGEIEVVPHRLDAVKAR